jgi:hypothetical protein
MKALYFVMLILASISTLYLYDLVISPNVDRRIIYEHQTFTGDIGAPYPYRVLNPTV